MKKDLYFFYKNLILNFKNAKALNSSFYLSLIGMVLNNSAFFVIWYFLLYTTGPINGWDTVDVFVMLGISMFCFGVTMSFFNGINELPKYILNGKFDSVLLSPRNIILRLSGMSLSTTAISDLIMGFVLIVYYLFVKNFSLEQIVGFIFFILCGVVVFFCIKLLTVTLSFYIHDGESIGTQIFDIFLRPGLYPGSMFTNNMKIFFITIIPILITSAIPIEYIKSPNSQIILITLVSTIFWVLFTIYIFNKSIKKYESGNFLR